MGLEQYNDIDIVTYLRYNGYYVEEKTDGNGGSTIDLIFQAKRNDKPYDQLIDKLIREMTGRIL